MSPLPIRCIALIGAAIVGIPAHANVVLYVDDDALPGGDGLSWSSANRYLQDALTTVQISGGDVREIRIAQGSYKADRSEVFARDLGSRLATFWIPSGVALRGGFAGVGAPDPDLQDFSSHRTILSGDLNSDDGPNFANNSENSLHILSGDNLDSGTMLEGLIIQGGYANSTTNIGHRRGAGLNLYGANLLIQDCSFTSNRAAEPNGNGPGEGGGCSSFNGHLQFVRCGFTANAAGTAAAILALDGSLQMTDCQFMGNVASGQGNGAAGAVYVGGAASGSFVSGCSFVNNLASNTAGLWFRNCPYFVVSNSVFTGNFSSAFGGAMTIESLNPRIINCAFVNNRGGQGGAIRALSSGTIEIQRCQFEDNQTPSSTWQSYGGAVYAHWTQPIITESTFHRNASTNGGAIYNFANFNVTSRMTDCVFDGNTASDTAGAICNDRAHSVLTHCVFSNNSALAGGALFEVSCHAVVTHCVFEYNRATATEGGAIICGASATPFVRQSVFRGNTAVRNGGAIQNYSSQLRLDNCMLLKNSAGTRGGALCTDQGHSALFNCAISGNAAAQGGGGIFLQYDAHTEVLNCVLFGNKTITGLGGGLLVFDCCGPFPSSSEASHAVVANSIFLSNTAGNSTNEAAQLTRQPFSTLSVQSCHVQGWTGLLTGTNNSSDDPMFVDPDGSDDIVGTFDDNFRLRADSRCIEKGDTTLIPENDIFDLDGRPRIIDIDHDGMPEVDRGAYEYVRPGDIDGDSFVNVDDLSLMITSWGSCPTPATPGSCPADFAPNGGDGWVNLDDLILLLVNWG